MNRSRNLASAQPRTLTLLLLACVLPIAMQAAPIHIVAYGDSGVAGKGVPAQDAYPAQLERMLRSKGYDVSVSNAGVNGRTSTDAVANLDSVPSSAKVVIVQFGVNDVKHGIAPAVVRKNIETVVAKLRARGAAVLVVGYPAVDLSGVAASHGALYVTWGGLPGAQYHVPGDPQNHFNAAGLRVMAERMVPALEKLIRTIQ